MPSTAYCGLPTAYCSLQLNQSGGGGGEPGRGADAAARAGVHGGAGRGRARDLRAGVLLLKEGAAHAGVYDLPREHFVVGARARGVEGGVHARLAQRGVEVVAVARHGLDDARDAAVAGGEERLLVRDARGHHAHLHVRDAREVLGEPLQAALEFALLADGLPLEGRVRLRHEAVQGRDDFPRAAEAAARLQHPVLDASDEFDHRFEVFVRLGRQARHHVELDGEHAAVEDGAADVNYLVVRQVLVDDAPQAVAARLGRNRYLLVARLDERVEQLIFNLVEPQRRDGNLVAHLAQAAQDVADFGVVADGGRNQTDLVGAPAPLFGLAEYVARGHDARRPVVEARPAEAAALRAAARNLDEEALAHLGRGRPDDGRRREDLGLLQPLDYVGVAAPHRAAERALLRVLGRDYSSDAPGHALEPRRVSLDGAVRLVRHVVERGRVEASADPRELQQQVLLRPALLCVLKEEVNELRHQYLALADGDHVRELGDGLGVEEGGGAAHQDERVVVRAVTCPDGNARELEHARHVEEVGLEGDGEGHDVEVAHGRLRLQGEERRVRALVLAQLRVVGQEDALARDLGHAVEQLVDRLEAEVRHPDRVHARVAERDAQLRAPLRDPPLLGGELPPVTLYDLLRHTSAKTKDGKTRV